MTITAFRDYIKSVTERNSQKHRYKNVVIYYFFLFQKRWCLKTKVFKHHLFLKAQNRYI